MPERVKLSELTPGMVITRVTKQHSDVPINKQGLVKDQHMIESLKAMGVSEVEVDPSLAVEIITPPHRSAIGKMAQHRPVQAQTTSPVSTRVSLPGIDLGEAPWRYYLGRVATMLLVLLMGAALGSGAGLLPALLVAAPEPQGVTTVSRDPGAARVQAQDMGTRVGKQEAPLLTGSLPPGARPATTGSQLVAAPDPHAASGMAASLQETADTHASDEAVPPVSQDERPLAMGQNAREQVAFNRGMGASAGNESGISPELMRRLAHALEEVAPQAPVASTPETGRETAAPVGQDITPVHQLPATVLTRIPGMSFSAHMYASEANERWVNVNGVEVGEGGLIEGTLVLERIEPQQVILSLDGHRFSLPALSDW